MIRITFIFALLLFSGFSCSKENETPVEPLEKFPAYISRVDAPEAATIGSTVPIIIYFSVKNGCGQFGSFEVEKKSDATHIKVYPKYREGVCTLDIPIRQVTYEFKPSAPGTYTFKFSPVYPDQHITKTIVVTSESR